MRRSSQSTLVTDTVLSLSPEKACPALPGSRRSVSSGSFLPLFLLRSLALTALFSSSDAVESDLRFLGLVIFENKLKPGTSPAIATFRQAHIPTRMVTGDNVRTAISVGRECAMILPTSRVFLPSFVKGAFLSLSPFRSTCFDHSRLAGGPSNPRSQIEWTDIEDEGRQLDSYSLRVRFLSFFSWRSRN
jgi:magnesium-transporting ATPase (P-type)